MCRSGIAGLDDSYSDFHSGWARLHSWQQGKTIISHILSAFLVINFPYDRYFDGIRWNFKVVLTYISMIARNVENFLKMLTNHSVFFFIFDSLKILYNYTYFDHMCTPLPPSNSF